MQALAVAARVGFAFALLVDHLSLGLGEKGRVAELAGEFGQIGVEPTDFPGEPGFFAAEVDDFADREDQSRTLDDCRDPALWIGLGGVAADDGSSAHDWQLRLHWVMFGVALLSVPAHSPFWAPRSKVLQGKAQRTRKSEDTGSRASPPCRLLPGQPPVQPPTGAGNGATYTPSDRSGKRKGAKGRR